MMAGFWTRIFGRGVPVAPAPKAEAATVEEPEQAGRVFSRLVSKMLCGECDLLFEVSVVGMEPGDAVHCPGCGKAGVVDPALFPTLEAQIAQHLEEAGHVERGSPRLSAISHYVRMHNRLPQAAERENQMSARNARFADAKYFPVAIVGESNFQRDIADCTEGGLVRIFHESDNPYDDRALVVKNHKGRPIGYLPRDSFVHRALLDEGQDFEAGIRAIVSKKGSSGVVIEIAFGGRTGQTVQQCHFQPR